MVVYISTCIFQLSAIIKSMSKKRRKLKLKPNGRESDLACNICIYVSAPWLDPGTGLNCDCAMLQISKVRPNFLSALR